MFGQVGFFHKFAGKDFEDKRNLINFYGARELVEFDTFKHVAAWLKRGLARTAVQRGLQIPKRG